MSSGGPPDILLVGAHAGVVAQPFESARARVRIRDPDEIGSERADVAVILDRGLDPRRFRAERRVVWNPDALAKERRALVMARPWPVADDIFDMQPSLQGDMCLVVTRDGAAADAMVRRLRERRLRVHVTPRVTREGLAEATVVVSVGEGLPAETFAILAARRLLVARATDRTFGLQPWVDFMPYANDDDLVQVADMLVSCPGCWAPSRALARQFAESQRASRALERLARRITAAR